MNQNDENFRRSFAQWALGDARREVSEEFPLIGSIRFRPVWRILEMMRSMPRIERLRVITSLARRWTFQQEQLSVGDLQVIDAFANEPVMLLLPEELEFQRRAEAGSLKLVKRCQLEALIKEEVARTI